MSLFIPRHPAGTLTENRMTVVEGLFAGLQMLTCPTLADLPAALGDTLCNIMALSSKVSVGCLKVDQSVAVFFGVLNFWRHLNFWQHWNAGEVWGYYAVGYVPAMSVMMSRCRGHPSYTMLCCTWGMRTLV